MDEESRYNPQKSWTRQAGEQDNEPVQQSAFFSCLRQPGQKAEYITFFMKDRTQHMLAASEIVEGQLDPDRGIVLFFPFGRVRIEGRNLEELVVMLRQKRVTEIREFSEDAKRFFDKEALFISKVHYESDNLKKLGG
jgi:hypothetical protein